MNQFLGQISAHPAWNQILGLLLNDSISEVQSNGYNEFFVKKNGRRIQLTNIDLGSEEAYTESIRVGLVPLIVSHLEFEEDGYLFEGPLRYTVDDKLIRGRCHIVLPPAADSAQVTIAKKSTALATLDAISESGSMAPEMFEFIKAAAAGDLTTVFSGGTGAGKTTFLEAFTKELNMSTRIGVAEDTPELALLQDNVSYLHSVPWRPGMEEKDVASLSWVVAQFNRMRTDKLIIGETRGKEFSDFLVAANSGMDGSLTTIHANDPVRALEKMANFALKGNPNQPMRSVNLDIANSIDLVVQLAYFKNDSRYRITAIQEITSTISDGETASITTNRLYTYLPDIDAWEKIANPTDDLKNKLKMNGASIEKVLQTQPGVIIYPSGKSAVEAAPGLPTRRI